MTGAAVGPAVGREVITVRGATKVFGTKSEEVVAFDGLDLTVHEGEALCIVGPSGCGKTTLLRCIDGLIELTDGEVRINGDVVRSPHPRATMVFQHFGLFPWMTIERNVAAGLKAAGVGRQERLARARESLELVGLAGFERRYPYQLSGGMQQRAGLARALTVEPDVLLMDEPFASVDAQTRELLHEQLLDIWQRRPLAMAFITHSIDEALVIGDRVAVLSSRPGRVKEVVDVPFGRPRAVEEVRADPRFGELRQRIWELLRRDASAELATS